MSNTTAKIEEALPPEAKPTGEHFGNSSVYETEQWRYLVHADGRVLNVVKKEGRGQS